jgi:hypothetical protein
VATAGARAAASRPQAPRRAPARSGEEAEGSALARAVSQRRMALGRPMLTRLETRRVPEWTQEEHWTESDRPSWDT